MKNISEGWNHHVSPPQTAPFNSSLYHNKPDTNIINSYTHPIDPSLPSPSGEQQFHLQQTNPILYYNNSPNPINDHVIFSPVYSSVPASTNGFQSPDEVHSPSLSLQESLQTIVYQPNPLTPTPTNCPQTHSVGPQTHSPIPMSLESSLVLPQDLSLILPLPLEPTNSSLNEYLDGYIDGTDRTDHTHFLDLHTRRLEELCDPYKDISSMPLLGKRQQDGHDANLHVKIPRTMRLLSHDKQENNHRPSSLPLSFQTETYSNHPHTYSNHPHTYTSTGSGHLSDTSSGVSSSSAKFSVESNHTSPSSSPCLVTSPFSYPSLKLGTLELPLKENVRITSIIEPHAGLGTRGEYMKDEPLLPPSPPSPTPSLDLHPNLPIYNVRRLFY